MLLDTESQQVGEELREPARGSRATVKPDPSHCPILTRNAQPGAESWHQRQKVNLRISAQYQGQGHAFDCISLSFNVIAELLRKKMLSHLLHGSHQEIPTAGMRTGAGEAGRTTATQLVPTHTKEEQHALAHTTQTSTLYALHSHSTSPFRGTT